MPETSVDVDVKSKGDMVIDQLTRKLGIFNKAGIGMGVAFAGVNIAVGLVQQGISGLINYITEGVEKNRQFELSLTRIGLEAGDTSAVGLANLRSEVGALSIAFATSTSEIAAGMQSFIREGANASQAINQMVVAERLAVVTGDDFTATQQAITTSLEVFDLDVEQTNNVAEDLNRIWHTTGLTMGDVARVFGSNAGKINEAGLSLDDMVGIMTELDQEGWSNRTMISQLGDILGDYKTAIDKATEGNKNFRDNPPIPTTTEAYEKISATTEYTDKMIASLREYKQMDLGGKLDIGATFNKGLFDNAKQWIEILKTDGITTLADFNQQVQAAHNPLTIAAGLLGLCSDKERDMIAVASQAGGDVLWLVREMLAYNAAMDKMATVTDQTKKTLKDWVSGLNSANDKLADYNKTAGDISMEERRITAVHDLTSQLHYMDLGLKDASYADRILDAQTASLVDSLRMQRDAIDELTQANEQYSLQSNENSLEMMKIQYEADEHGGRMTREQEARLKELQHANDLLRINTMENQDQIDKTQMDMGPEQARLNAIKTRMGEEVATYQDTYNKEILALEDKRRAEDQLIDGEILKRQGALDAIAKIHNEQWLIEHTSGPITGPQFAQYTAPVPPGWGLYQGQPISPILVPLYRDLPGYRQYHVGGDVLETGLAMVRQGERITPPGGTPPGPALQTRPVFPRIEIYLHVENADNLDRFARKLGEAIGKKLITGDIQSVYHFKG